MAPRLRLSLLAIFYSSNSVSLRKPKKQWWLSISFIETIVNKKQIRQTSNYQDFYRYCFNSLYLAKAVTEVNQPESTEQYFPTQRAHSLLWTL
jgi:hypothetical protein